MSTKLNGQASRWLPPLLTLIICLTLAAFVTGCAYGPQVRSATAPDVDLADDFRIVGFFPELSTDRVGFHTIVSRQLVSSTRREMGVRGFTYVENSAEADLLINFHSDVSEQFRVRNATAQHWRGSSF